MSNPDVKDRPLKITGTHPAAALFPPLAPDELEALTQDIADNGLRNAITVCPDPDIPDGYLVLDGVNRGDICQRLGITPHYVIYEGDPVAFVISQNIRRRHLTAGQRAIAEAKLTEKLDSSLSPNENAEQANVGRATMVRARYIVRHAPDLADLVLTGAQGFEPAYNKARERRLSEEARQDKLRRLQEMAPDLAVKVSEDQLDLDEQLAAAEERLRKQQDERRRTTTQIIDRISAIARYHGAEAQAVANYDAHAASNPLDGQTIDDAIAVLREWKKLLRKQLTTKPKDTAPNGQE